MLNQLTCFLKRRSKSLPTVMLASGLLLALPAVAAEPDWTPYAQLLEKHVRPGERDGVALNLVDYSALKNDPLWPQVVALVEQFPVEQLASPQEKLGFHINAYNIFALKMVLDHWPLESIKDAGSLLRPVWKKPVGTLGGKTVTLQQVEDDLLRSMGEPRIHMAIVCASVSCPDLRTEPYRAATLETQLEDQARTFLANKKKGLYLEDDTAHVSKIFGWFEDDFAVSGGVEKFLRRYQSLPEALSIDTDIDYNWQLNGQ